MSVRFHLNEYESRDREFGNALRTQSGGWEKKTTSRENEHVCLIVKGNRYHIPVQIVLELDTITGTRDRTIYRRLIQADLYASRLVDILRFSPNIARKGYALVQNFFRGIIRSYPGSCSPMNLD
ncbi:hypothetical protein NPIL_159141 [Nephila pilipes]|uniref:Uncharacterized protein n=1 Tax=Nephila pilipes TaxID=299642 RepID=A0A8X6QVI2_NEPPI|nr:hypothetical protein NPIL_159141 [Nephila pilipes]